MTETKYCPNCGAENKGVDLVETEGVYICYLCRKVVDSKTDTIVDVDVIENTANEKGTIKRK